jgi:hypothetical protein
MIPDNTTTAQATAVTPTPAPNASQGVPMMAPGETVPRSVSPDQVQAGIANGGNVVVRMADPQGKPHWVNFDQQDAAQKSGGTWLVHADNESVKNYINANPGVVPGSSPAPSAPAAPQKSRSARIWDAIIHPETTGASSINLGSQGGDAPQSLPANSQPGTIEQGAEKGLTATMGGVSGLFGGPGTTKVETTPNSPTEWAGYALEAAAEFYAGDEAFKALSVADKFKKLQTVAQIMEEHPTLAKVFAVGSKALRQESVASIQAFIHGASPKKALETGAIVGASGAVLDAAAPYIEPYVSRAGNAVKSLFTGGDDAGVVAGPMGRDAVATAEAPTVQPAGEPSPAKGTVQETVVKNTNAAKLPVGEDLAAGAQQHLQDSMTDEINNMADDAGVPRPKVSSPQQMSQEIADSVFKRSKAEYKLVDGATAGRFQPNADKLANVNLKLRDIRGTDDVAEAALEVQKTKLITQQDQIFEDAAKNGVPQKTVDAAKKDFHTAQAQYDLNRQLRLSAPTSDPNLLDPTKLRNRLTKFNVPEEGGAPSRFEQAAGTTRAKSMLDHAATAQEMATMSPTESKALTELVSKRTGTSLFRGGTTDWKGVLSDFDNLGAQEQKARFTNPQGVTNFLRSQARQQWLKKYVAGGALALTPAIGTAAYELMK